MHEILVLLGKLSVQIGGRCYLRLFGDGSWTVRDDNNACIVGPFNGESNPTQQIVMQLALAIHTPTKAEALEAMARVHGQGAETLRRYLEAQPDDAQGEAK
jgi:hypothetical protein